MVLLRIASTTFLLLIAVTASAGAPVLRTWHDDTGKFELRATLVDAKYDKDASDTLVTLEKADGTRVVVPLQRLCKDDRTHIEQAVSGRQSPTAARSTLAGGAERNPQVKKSSPKKSAALGAVPPGAAALGYTKCVIKEKPTARDIAPGHNGNFKWFSGQWYKKSPPSLDHYQTKDGMLTLSLGGDLVSAPRDFSRGWLPVLPGADGFYVEFDVRLSDDDQDHWPAVWLMPVEHNRQKWDHYSGDPEAFERWMELDVDEGGFGPGLTGSVHSWSGIWPKFERASNRNHISRIPIRRSETHTFGAGYDPVSPAVIWWVDGVEQMSAGPPHVPAIAARQHFYLLITAQTHGKKIPYTMFVSGVRAYVPPKSPLSAVR